MLPYFVFWSSFNLNVSVRCILAIMLYCYCSFLVSAFSVKCQECLVYLHDWKWFLLTYIREQAKQYPSCYSLWAIYVVRFFRKEFCGVHVSFREESKLGLVLNYIYSWITSEKLRTPSSHQSWKNLDDHWVLFSTDQTSHYLDSCINTLLIRLFWAQWYFYVVDSAFMLWFVLFSSLFLVLLYVLIVVYLLSLLFHIL